MSGTLILVVMVIYAVVGADQALKGNWAMAWTWLCYSGANIGLFMVSSK